MSDYDRPVAATAEQLADLYHRFETDLDSTTLAEYAISIGVHPPDDPPGYKGWEIVEAYPGGDYDNGVLYWLGPHEDHGAEN